MTRVLAALTFCAALLLGAGAASAQGTTIPHTCSQAIALTQSVLGTTGLVGPNATIPATMPAGGGAAQKLTAANGILICGYSINIAATGGTAGLEYGTQVLTACDTGPIPLTPAWAIGATQTLTDNADYFRGLFVPPGQTLCLVTTGAPASVIVYYDNLPF